MASFVRRTSRIVAILSAAAVLALAGCDDDTTSPEPDPAVYEGGIAGVGEFDEITGSATIELDDHSFDVELSLADHPDQGDGFPWILKEGTCAAPGDEVGELADYPLIEPDSEGEWSDLVALELSDAAEEYALEIRRSGDDETTMIACGDLEKA